MKKLYTLSLAVLFLMLFSSVQMANAANSQTEVDQVTEAVSVTGDVDYIITNTTPFGSLGSVNIESLEHAVVIIKNIKPSLVIKNWLSHIFINGEKAANETNCQVKMFGRGTIIFPYGKNFRPLTCYTEANYGGESSNNYTEGHVGGFMKTLNDATLNNKIHSFKLKRGYMVTFAIGTGGWGYSRCFIADMEDLEVPTLSNVLDGRISSYRLFKWFNAHKAGLASDGRVAANNAVNSSWCYDWAGGNTSTLPDTEWVPNHIYEDWPSPGSIGSRDGTCHSKANNEPGNSADDTPQDVATVLANWPNMMRTGLRLCSETSHDGSMGHLRDFIDSIDARGWRCDILDLHCYWASGSFNNLTSYSDNYGHGRPIWISEWVWGASWNNNGIFGAVSDRSSTSQATQQTCYDGTKPILDILNSNTRVERYAYWNSEANCSKIYLSNGTLTTLGKYYSTMNVPLGFNRKNEFIPRDPRMESLGTLTASYSRTSGSNRLSWSDPNGDLSSEITVMCKLPGSTLFKSVGTVTPKDKSSASGAVYSYDHEIDESGIYTYRIRVKSYKEKVTYLYTNEVTVNADPSRGTDTFQYGKLSTDNTDELSTYYSETMVGIPRVFIGTRNNKNTTFFASNITCASNTSKYFTYQLRPWANSKAQSPTSQEEIPFMSLMAGNYDFGGLQCEVGDTKSGKSSEADPTVTDVTEVTFTEPFPEGVTPIVLAEIRNPNFKSSALGIRVFDVTNTGFKFVVFLEASCTVKLSLTKNVSYFAIAPGVGTVDAENNIYIAAGHGKDNQIYGTALRANNYYITQTDPETNEEVDTPVYMEKPLVFASLQTNNYPALCQLRKIDNSTKLEDGTSWYTGFSMVRAMDHNITVDGQDIPYTSVLDSHAQYRDNVGWVCISSNIWYEELIPTGIESVKNGSDHVIPIVQNRQISVSGTDNYTIYKVSGVMVPKTDVLEPGIYIVRAHGKAMKVVVQ